MSDLEKAGEIATEVLKTSKGWVKEGILLSEIADKVEEEILNLGGEIAFPCSLAVNDCAAHYAPLFNDESKIPKNSIVKLDLGVHINGAICDVATTINFNEELKYLEKASLASLKAVIETVKEGITLSEVGGIVEETMYAHKCKPIYNLSGHSLGPYMVHSGINIPNYDNKSNFKLLENHVFAIEPFSTNGEGYVIDKGKAGIFNLNSFRNTRNPLAKKIILEMYNKRKTLPFAERWLHKMESSNLKLNSALLDLINNNIITSYPPLCEKTGGMVSQHECTIVIEKNSCRVIGGEING
jgi:methionyl aminopeptidase